MRPIRKLKRGQALVMVTIAFIAMSGLIGLAVDLGWSYFVRRAAQSAADAAALAAVNNAWDAVQSGTAFDCTGLSCISTPTECAGGLGGNTQSACQYAQKNGFSSGGDHGRQSVRVSSGWNLPPAPPPNVPGVNAYYWVTVTVSTTIPQLYSAILGNTTSTVAARATAAIVNVDVRASLIALNRPADRGPNGATDLKIAPLIGIQAANGIFLSSTDNQSGLCQAPCFGVTANAQGDPVYTLIRESGTAIGKVSGAPAGWTWQNQGEGAPFWDPMRGLGQPPLTSNSLPSYAVPGGILDTTLSPCNTGTCQPGAYYAVDSSGNKGGPLTINSNLNFGGGSFGNFVFYGGLTINGAAVDFGPGEYIFAGVLPNSNNYDLSITGGPSNTGSTITGGNGTDAGRVFIFTNSSYPGLSTAAPVSGLPTLNFGPSQIIGNTTTMNLYGLDATRLPTDTGNAAGYHLTDFGPLSFWQDQRFSYVKYTSNGNVDTSAGCGGSSLDSPCTQTPVVAPNFLLGAGDGSHAERINGTFYQPRGAWTTITSGAITAMQMISGAFDLSNNTAGPGGLKLPPLPNGRTRRAVALIQ